MLNSHDSTYLALLKKVLQEGEERTDRTGVGTIGIFGAQMRFSLRESFPLLTTKRLHWKSIVHELLWIMSGSTNIKYLKENGVSIWNEWADEDGELGPVYGKQWRNFSGVDQLANVVETLKTDPHSRRHIITAWNPIDVPNMALPPCHAFVQFWVSQEDNSLHCQLYQRSADMFLGVPFNIASYSLLTCILADTLDFERGSFTWTGGDVHIYQNHIEQVKEQLSRLEDAPPAPVLAHVYLTDPLAATFDDIMLIDYDPLPGIKAPVAV